MRNNGGIEKFEPTELPQVGEERAIRRVSDPTVPIMCQTTLHPWSTITTNNIDTHHNDSTHLLGQDFASLRIEVEELLEEEKIVKIR